MALDTRTCFWFASGGPEAAEFYISLLPDSGIDAELSQADDGSPLVVNFHLLGTPYQILQGGPAYPQTHAASISVLTEDQAETDRLWDALTAGGEGGHCGWLRDRWGLHWQIVPEALPRLLSQPDRAAAGRVMQAMLAMGRLEVAGLEAASAGQGG